MAVQVGYVLRIGYYGRKRCTPYISIQLDDPIVVDGDIPGRWDDPFIHDYCDAAGEEGPELIPDLETARRFWHGFAKMDTPTMLLQVTYSDGSPDELVNAEPGEGEFLGFDVGDLGGTFDSLVIGILSEPRTDLVEQLPPNIIEIRNRQLPIMKIVRGYFRPRLNDNRLLSSAEDAILLKQFDDAMAEMIPGYRCCGGPPDVCRVALIERFPATKSDPGASGFIDPRRFAGAHIRRPSA